jgi:AcrR family transcriptional regulator
MATDEQRVPSVWARGPRRRGGKPTLSRERIVAEAIALADAEGLDALSMRRLGTRLGVGATSIYWHVPNKEQLVELVVDEVFGEMDVPDAADVADWRDEVANCGHSMRAMILRHPWMATMMAQSAMAGYGPNAVRLSEGIIGVLRAVGLTPLEAEHATSALAAYVLGNTTSEAAWMQVLARTGKTEEEILQQMMPVAEEAAKGHPHTQAVLDSYVAAYAGDPAKLRDESFVYGVELLLDGLQARIARKPKPRSRSKPSPKRRRG